MKHGIWLAIWILIVSCAEDRHAGSTSVTTNGTVSGVIKDSAGVVLAGVDVYLVSSLSGVDTSWLQRTDERGRYQFSQVIPGEYRVLVRDLEAELGGLSEDLHVESAGEIEAVVELDTLLRWRVPLQKCTAQVGDVFWVPGTDVSVTVTEAHLQAGELWFAHLPKAEYAQVFQRPTGANLSWPLIMSPVLLDKSGEDVACDYQDSMTSPQGFATHGRALESIWGGAGGDTVVAQDTTALRMALADDLSRVILVKGVITGNGNMLRVGSNKSILGLGDDASFTNLGLAISQDSNIVIRNIHFKDGPGDAISIEESAHHIWVDHNTLENYGDGLLDIKRASDWITVSWNQFLNHKDVGLVGHSDENGVQDTLTLHVSYHLNWYAKVQGSAPRVRYGQVHVFNNLYQGLSNYAVASTQFAQVVFEGNDLEDVSKPTLTQHTSDYAGALSERLNLYLDCGAVQSGGVVFDPAMQYAYSLQPVEQVRALVQSASGVGRLALRNLGK